MSNYGELGSMSGFVSPHKEKKKKVKNVNVHSHRGVSKHSLIYPFQHFLRKKMNSLEADELLLFLLLFIQHDTNFSKGKKNC